MKLKVLIGLLSISILTACKVDSSDLDKNTSYFRKISYEKNGWIVYDTRTGVEYWYSTSRYNAGSLTLLVDKEGKPLIYERIVEE